MERLETHNDNEHVIDITNTFRHSSSNSPHERPLEHQHIETSTSSRVQIGNNRAHPRSPFNSGLWISVELALTVGQIIAAIIVLSLSKHEKPNRPLKAWIVGYAFGCLATLPLLYWRFRYGSVGFEHDSSQNHPEPSGNGNAGSLTSRAGSLTSRVEDHRTSVSSTRGNGNTGLPDSRLKVLKEYFKMGLDGFFAVWFVVGSVWIFGGQSSSSVAPNLYRLCLVFLVFSCIGYAMPFILCTTVCCCLPCIISVLGSREDFLQNRGATQESINSLPTFKFKMRKNKSGNDRTNNSDANEGGIVAVGTEKERAISGEDAVCCICLAPYANNDELRELPCSHFFHKECVDKWLKINATCPLCKAMVGGPILSSLTEATANLHNGNVL